MERKLDHRLSLVGRHFAVAEAQYQSAVLQNSPGCRCHSTSGLVEARKVERERWWCCRSKVELPYRSQGHGQAESLQAIRYHDMAFGQLGDGDEQLYS